MKNKVCTLLLLKKDDQILLAMKKRGFGSNLYNGVGGKIDPGETVEQALIRECQEEIAVTPTNYWKVAENDFAIDTDTEKPWHMYVHTYLCDAWEGEPIETEEMAPQWFNVADIPYTQMWQDDPFWLPQVLANQKIIGLYVFGRDNKFLKHTVTVVDELPNIIPSVPEV